MERERSFRLQLWISAGIIFGSMAAAAAGLYFLSNDLAAQSAKIVNDKNFIAAQTAVVGELASLKNEEAESVPYLTAMQKLLPTHDQLIGFPGWVDALAQAHGVSASVSFTGQKADATASSPASDAFSLEVSGPPSGIVSFLADMETKASGYLLAIDSFDFRTNGSDYSLAAQGRVFSR